MRVQEKGGVRAYSPTLEDTLGYAEGSQWSGEPRGSPEEAPKAESTGMCKAPVRPEAPG